MSQKYADIRILQSKFLSQGIHIAIATHDHATNDAALCVNMINVYLLSHCISQQEYQQSQHLYIP